jgi:hypothetical protein
VYSTADNTQIAPEGVYFPANRTIIWSAGEVGSQSGGYANLSINLLPDTPEGAEIINYATVYFPSVPEETRTNGVVSIVGVNHPPAQPVLPDPADNRRDVDASATLQWSCSDPDRDTLQYDVYFGNSTSPPLIGESLPEQVFPVDSLAPFSTYYWKVVAKDPDGLTAEGPVWNFTTHSHPQAFSIRPAKHARGGKSFSAAIKGTGFLPDVPGTTLTIWRGSPEKNITAGRTTPQSAEQITGVFRIPKKAKTGLYNVTVTNPDNQSVTLVNGFKVRR